MTYSESLADRIRDIVGDMDGMTEKKMFGGLVFLFRRHMSVGIVGDTLMVRVGKENYEKLLAEKHAREMDFTGRPIRGMLYVDPAGIHTKQKLSWWIQNGLLYAQSLPPKK